MTCELLRGGHRQSLARERIVEGRAVHDLLRLANAVQTIGLESSRLFDRREEQTGARVEYPVRFLVR